MFIFFQNITFLVKSRRQIHITESGRYIQEKVVDTAESDIYIDKAKQSLCNTTARVCTEMEEGETHVSIFADKSENGKLHIYVLMHA